MEGSHMLQAMIQLVAGASVLMAFFGGFLHALMVRRNPRHLWYALAKAGYSLIVGILIFVVAKAPSGIPTTTLTVTYFFGLVLAAVGFFGTAFDAIYQFVDYIEEDRRADTAPGEGSA